MFRNNESDLLGQGSSRNVPLLPITISSKLPF